MAKKDTAKKSTTKDAVKKSGRQMEVDTLMKLRIVVRAAQRHSSWIEKHCGLTGAQLWILQELKDAPGLRVGEVAAKLAIHQTTTSNLLNVLLDKGYIEKIRDMEDQRVVKLVLSKEGATVLKKAPKPARSLLPEVLRQLDAGSLSSLNKGLDAMLDVIGDVDEKSALQPFSFNM
jgi:DNA-binding MarR family transcriptional regulator